MPSDVQENNRGYYAEFESSSGNGIYRTQYWTEDYNTIIKEGDISCDCPGWRFRRACKHQGMLRDLLVKQGILK